MTPKKPKRVQVYFASDNQDLHKALVESSKKVSCLGFNPCDVCD